MMSSLSRLDLFVSFLVLTVLPVHMSNSAPAAAGPSQATSNSRELVQLLSVSTGRYVVIDSSGGVNANGHGHLENQFERIFSPNNSGRFELKSNQHPHLFLAIDSDGRLTTNSSTGSGSWNLTVSQPVTKFAEEVVVGPYYNGETVRLNAIVGENTCYVAFEDFSGLPPTNVCHQRLDSGSDIFFDLFTHINIIV